ncbi:hypothetical protein DOY81_011632, partial [Sarcophaga bullata]
QNNLNYYYYYCETFIKIMNNFISFALVISVSMATVSCGSYCGNWGYGGSAAAPSSTYNTNSYSLVEVMTQLLHQLLILLRLLLHMLHQLNLPTVLPNTQYNLFMPTNYIPVNKNYQVYHSAPIYSQVALPVIPSAPVAKLYVPAQQSYAAPADIMVVVIKLKSSSSYLCRIIIILTKRFND